MVIYKILLIFYVMFLAGCLASCDLRFRCHSKSRIAFQPKVGILSRRTTIFHHIVRNISCCLAEYELTVFNKPV